MNATKILWGQIVLVSFVVLVFVWTATEVTAWRLGFQPQLGNPWFELFGWPVYPPVAFFWWWFSFEAYAPDIFDEGGYIAAAGGIAAIAVATTMSVLRAREAKRVTTYGSARWAETREIREAGLLGDDGILLGRWRGDYLRHDGPEHVLCFAPTRSGKGVGLVVPTLLTWPDSAIVNDIKGENWTLTAGWRARFGRVLLFDPTNARSAAYNPLLEVRRGEWEVRDVQNIADVLVDPEGALEKRNHWEKTSHAFLVGTILHVLYAERDKTLAGVANFLSDPKRPIETTLRAMMTTPHLGESGVHPVVASAARELLNKSENERSGVLSTAMSFLGLYRDPVVATVTRRCDWRIQSLSKGLCRPRELHAAIKGGAAAGSVRAQVKALDSLLGDAETALDPRQATPWSSFLGSFTVLLREALEALLIVVVMITLLRKAERQDVEAYVHGGWISALAAGALTWAGATYVISISGAGRELTEGFGSLFAAIVLLWVGIWMHGKSHADAWQRCIRDKLGDALSRQSAWGLFGLAFVVVYREVFETILFYIAIWNAENAGAIIAGAGAAVISLAVIAWALMRYGRALPVGKLLAYSSALIAVLCVVLIGKSVSALQEAGWLPVNPLAGFIRMEMLGIYPTVQGLAAQVVVAALLLIGFWNNQRRISANRNDVHR